MRIMRQAIITKFLGPTNHRGSRVKAICEARTLVVEWDHALDPNDNHWRAATTLAEGLGWIGEKAHGWSLAGGGMPQKGNDYACCFVLVKEDE